MVAAPVAAWLETSPLGLSKSKAGVASDHCGTILLISESIASDLRSWSWL